MPGSEFAEFEQRLNRPVSEKLVEFETDYRLHHLIFAKQLTPALLEELRRSADVIRKLSRSPTGANLLRKLLSHKRAMLYFTQPSTRTFLSFMAACQILGLTCNEVRDPKTSSEVKRESPMDSIRMFSSYFDVIIMRSQKPNYAECCAYLMNDLMQRGKRWVPIINGGAGSDEHPTQALLDVYTILRTFEFGDRDPNEKSRYLELKAHYPSLIPGPEGKTYAFCGDIGRGRTVKSLATVLAKYADVRMFFIAPDHPQLKMDRSLRGELTDAKVPFYEFNTLDAVHEGMPILDQVDCLYMTRIQREHNTPSVEAEIAEIDFSHFCLSLPRLARLRSYVPIMHPFPRDSEMNEIPTSIDNDPRVMYFRQARNGMWARASLLVHIFKLENQLHALSLDLDLGGK
ncbi:MAG TPA: hypothetical protein PKD64_14535 [Pirellulaceae bacterium]|nr:hypothetical protein [Pirellulaceae bacterium]HMO93399.1 hypothetical protein [Pirellulaceae bacterium]HMP70477.1 hypothetical protein [Pirellulaceae bacterium]